MHTCEIHGRVRDTGAEEVFKSIADFERYARHGQSIRSIEVEQLDDGRILSRWDVDFRGGFMKWTEEDRVDDESHRIDFEQTEGNLRHFSGHWKVDDGDGGATIEFFSEFELGMATLGSFIDPIAEAAIRENLTAVMQGLFGERFELAQGGAPAGA